MMKMMKMMKMMLIACMLSFMAYSGNSQFNVPATANITCPIDKNLEEALSLSHDRSTTPYRKRPPIIRNSSQNSNKGDDLRQELSIFSNKIDDLLQELDVVSNDIEKVQQDISVFSRQTTEITKSTGLKESYNSIEYVVFNLINDKTIVEIGNKYTDIDFEANKANLVAEIKYFKTLNDNYDKEYRDLQAAISDKERYVQNMQNELGQNGPIGLWGGGRANPKSNPSRVKKLNDDISLASKELDQLRNKISMVNSKYNEKLERRIEVLRIGTGRNTRRLFIPGELFKNKCKVYITSLAEQCKHQTIDSIENTMNAKLNELKSKSNEIKTEINDLYNILKHANSPS